MGGFREEKDSMGTVLVPEDAYYGAQTQRAIDNFRISSLRFPPVFHKRRSCDDYGRPYVKKSWLQIINLNVMPIRGV